MKRRPRLSSFVLSLSILAAGCGSVPPEQKIVQDFFRASRLNDAVALGTFATATFDRGTHGQVQTFEVVEISAERGTPASLRDLAEALDAALEAERAFSQEKMEYQTKNIKAIERVIAQERRQEPISRQDQPVQAAWTKWRADSAHHAKTVSEARQRLQSARRIVELSLSQPNGRTPDASRMTGEMIEKDVTVLAKIRTPQGDTVERTLVVTLARASMREADNAEPVVGRWIVRRVRGTDPEKPTA